MNYSQADLDRAMQYSRYKPKSKTIENLALLFAVVRAEERERCAHIAVAIDSKRGNEKEIARAIRAMPDSNANAHV